MNSISLGFVAVLNSIFLSQSYEVKPDRKIEASAAARAAARVGDLRGTIGYDSFPVIITPNESRKRRDARLSLIHI